MATYAIGPVENDVLTANQVVRAMQVADLSPVPSGRQRIDVSAIVGADNPNTYVGRRFNVGPPVSLVPHDPIPDRRPEWFARLGRTYRSGMDAIQHWWPTQNYSETPANAVLVWRSRDIVNYEIPNWWLASHIFAAAAVRGEYPAMTEAQIEAVVAHPETLMRTRFPAAGTFPAAENIIHRWYQVGRSLNLGDRTAYTLPQTQAMPGPGRTASEYADSATFTVGYTDMYSFGVGVLTPRTPDYAWNSLTFPSTHPADFDPENPS